MFNVSQIQNQKFYLNNTFISGIQSLSLNYDTNITPSFAISNTGMNYIINQPIIANFNLNYIPGTSEPFIDYTGNSFFTGKIEYGDKYLYFSSGFIDGYSIDAQLDRPVEVSVQGRVLGELSYLTGINTNNSAINYEISPINYCYIDFNLAETNLNRVSNCGISYSCKKLPIYTIGNYVPSAVTSEYPIEVSCRFNFEISDESISSPYSFFSNLQTKDLQVNFKNINNSAIVKSFNLNKMIYSNKNYNFSVNEYGKFDLNFQGYINS
jgi:hypothetical protein